MSSYTMRHKAHDEIKKRIIFYESMPGERLSDKHIAADLGIGRTPVREALLILEQEKLVQCNGRGGYIVRKLTQQEVNQYLSIREVLEAFAVPMILQNVTPALIEELQESIENSKACAPDGDIHRMLEYHAKFHNAIYSATQSEVFIEIMSKLNDKYHWFRAIALKANKKSPKQAWEDHRKIVKALQEKNPKALKKMFKLHLRHTLEKYNAVAALFK